MKNFCKLFVSILFIQSVVVYASPINQFYGSINTGVFQAQFASKLIDQTVIPPQSVSDTFIQHGYTGGLALGYTHLFASSYFTSLELSGNIDGNSASFQSEASNTSFSDKIQINNHIDLTINPGIITQSKFFPYIKLGFSRASLKDFVNTPVGQNPVMMQYNTNKTIYGFVAGLGVRYLINDHVWLFVETNYHDYGTVNLSSFMNYTANYTHSAHVYSYAGLIGASYDFNI